MIKAMWKEIILEAGVVGAFFFFFSLKELTKVGSSY